MDGDAADRGRTRPRHAAPALPRAPAGAGHARPASFWRTGYFEVRKDLKDRYPKHSWPDDPLAATPTAAVKPRR